MTLIIAPEKKETPPSPFKKMLNGHLVVQIDDFKYSGRLVIPDSAKRRPTKGKVVAKAEDIVDIELGETVLFSQFAGYLLIFENMPVMRTLSYSEVLGILNESAPELAAEA